MKRFQAILLIFIFIIISNAIPIQGQYFYLKKISSLPSNTVPFIDINLLKKNILKVYLDGHEQNFN